MSRIDQALHELKSIDELARGTSPVHHFSPLSKLLVSAVYILTVMSFPKYALSELFLMILYPVIISALSGIELRLALKRMRYVLPLVMAVGLFNPLLDRRPVLFIGTLPVSGGILSLLSLMMKGIFCLLASFFLIGTTPADRLFASLRKIHLPSGIVTLLLLTWRYLTVLGEEAAVMMTAYHLRAPGQKGLHWRTWGSFIGQLLLRTLDRGRELYDSMLLRGYQGDFPAVRQEKFRLKDLLYVLAWISCFIILRKYNIAALIGRGAGL